MVRTQLQIDNVTYEALRDAAHKQKRSMSAVVREILHEKLGLAVNLDVAADHTALQAKYGWIGTGKTGETELSIRHDDYLAEELG